MKHKISTYIIITILSFIGLGSLLIIPSYAATIDCGDNTIPQSVRDAAGCDNSSSNALPTVVQNLLNVVIGITGIIAVIFIIIGGVQYMTSTGDAGKITKAKNTILYAVIGLVVVILAFAIVNFVIANVK